MVARLLMFRTVGGTSRLTNGMSANPLLHSRTLPDPPCCHLYLGFREVRDSLNHAIHALSRNAEHLCDFGYADQMAGHGRERIRGGCRLATEAAIIAERQ